MEAADDAAARVAPAGGLVVGGEYGVTGTARGAEERCLWHGEKVEIAHHGQLRRRVVTQTGQEDRRVDSVVSDEPSYYG